MTVPAHAARVVQIVIGALLAVLLLLVGIGAVLPRDWRVERSVMINAPPAAVHAAVGDLRHWREWAQWNQEDLSPRNEISMPSSGVGATLTWYGRGDTISGSVRIVRSDAERGVWFESRTADAAPSRAEVTFTPRTGVTEVTWRDEGRLPPIVGALFRDYFQQRLAAHMTTGLTRLKALVETGVPPL